MSQDPLASFVHVYVKYVASKKVYYQMQFLNISETSSVLCFPIKIFTLCGAFLEEMILYFVLL